MTLLLLFSYDSIKLQNRITDMEIKNKLTGTRQEGEGVTKKEGEGSSQGTGIKDPWTRTQTGRIENGRWE